MVRLLENILYNVKKIKITKPILLFSIFYYFWYLTFTLPSSQFLSPPVNACKFCFHIHVCFP